MHPVIALARLVKTGCRGETPFGLSAQVESWLGALPPLPLESSVLIKRTIAILKNPYIAHDSPSSNLDADPAGDLPDIGHLASGTD
ncbi:MAG: hypothetical protein WCA35_00950 [Kovacikia sp.]